MAADTAQTLFNKYIANYEGKLDSQETRESRYGALNLHLNDTKMVDSGMGVVGQDQRVNGSEEHPR